MKRLDQSLIDALRASNPNDKTTPLFFENQLLTYAQAALYLGVSPQYLRELKAARLISAVEIGRRCVRFRIASLNQFIEERESK